MKDLNSIAPGIQMIPTADWTPDSGGGVVCLYLHSSDYRAVGKLISGWIRDGTPITVIAVLSQPTLESLASLISGNSIFRVVKAFSNFASLRPVLALAGEHHDREVRRRDLLRQVRDQNRELEVLTKGLERRVDERTQSLVESKTKLELRLSQLRELLLFMKELGHVQDLGELLALIRKDFKKFHRLGDPCLAYAQPSGALRIMYFRGSQIFQRPAMRPWSSSPRIRHGWGEDAQYLANELGRPVPMTLSIPLARRSANFDVPSPTLFFEHNLKSNEIEEILSRLSERIQSVSFALDRLLIEHDVRSAVYMWEQTFDGIEDPVAVIDDSFKVLRGNAQFTKAASSAHCYAQFAGLDKPCRGCPLAASAGSPSSAEDRREPVVRRDGKTFRVYSYPLLHENGRPSSTYVHYYLDMTRQLGLQEQMIQTEKMAALGHLAGHIAHELNNPLTGIRGLCQVLRTDSKIPENVKKDLAEVEFAASRSQAIISNLLQFAESGSQQVTKIDLNEVLKNTLPLLKTAISYHRSDIQLHDSPALVFADGQLIQQVIFNLLKNACQAMETPGDLVVSIAPEMREAKPWWVLTIQDSGVGLSADVRSNLFTPFFTTKKKGDGTGLGLSMSRTVVERFGGKIEVDSAPGQGTSFRIVLPAVEKA